MRIYLCKLSFSVGGQSQANKNNGYQNTAAPCADNANAAAYCAQLISGGGSPTCASAGIVILLLFSNSYG